ncbi:MAG TPA: amidohydrolase family protein [Candidatus Angelobacter sp.]|nr:amidohydrolase family protein [Candidatus Angelobacter sp.]
MKLPNKFALVLFVLIAFGHLVSAADHSVLACIGAKIYPSPTAPPINNGVLIVKDGKIAEVAAKDRVKQELPQSAVKLDCAGKVVVAGFWNSHVHFENGWDHAATAPAAALQAHMQQMLTQWGFTTVWDLGSDPGNTIALRKRVEAGDVLGPKILMAGDIFPKNGHPVYLPPELQLPEAATPQQADQMARGYLQMGLDGIKLFTGAFMGPKPVINMDTAIVKAAVDVAHAQGKPVFAHPQNRTGVDNALAGGVNILAHTIPTEKSFTPGELAQMKQQHTALIPTLTLWTTVVQDPAIASQLVQSGVGELKSYFSQGGTILFGTDVGFTSRYDTTQEYEFMGRAMGWKDILAALTTNPSAYFKAPTKGRIEKGMDADFVVLDGDPAQDVRNLAKVKYTVRGGKVIYQK